MGRDILLLTAYFKHSMGFRNEIIANLMHDVCFLTGDGRLPFILGADFNFPPSPWQDSSLHGGSLWIQKLGVSVVAPVGFTHTCRSGRGQKPDKINYFLVSTRIRPLKQNCEVVKSGPWGPHYGVRITLNTNFESVVVLQLMCAYSEQRNTMRKLSTTASFRTEPNQTIRHAGKKQGAVVFLLEGSRVVRTGRRSPRWHAPNARTQLGFWKRQTSWATLWRPGVTLLPNAGRVWGAKDEFP